MAASRRCSQSGEGPLRTPRTSRSAKAGQSFRSASSKARVTRTGQGSAPGTGCDRVRLEPPEARRREVAGDAVDRGAVRPVRRQADLDHRVGEPRIGRVRLPDRRVRQAGR